MEDAKWMSWNEVPWMQRNSLASPLIRLTERILKSDSLTGMTADLASEFGVAVTQILKRNEQWEVVAARGESSEPIPALQLTNLVDRDSGVLIRVSPQNSILAVPTGSSEQHVLLFSGSRLSLDQLPDGLVMGRVLGIRIDQLKSLQQSNAKVERLQATMRLARTFAGETETQRLLEQIARDASTLLGTDRASIFVWDREQRQLIACPALGVAGGRLFLPDNRGIVGEVIQTRRSVIVDQAYQDPRFDQAVDKSSGYKTRNLLCVPLFDAADNCLGAFEVINKIKGDFTSEDEEALEDFGVAVATAMTNTRELENLVRNNAQLNEHVKSQSNLVGESSAVQALRSTIERLAMTDLPVLILGESGTGKEVAASSLHQQGHRANRPYVAVNCAALSESLLESELFGHEKGAFTDAHSQHVGKFELAEGGTLFLDEIGDMSLGGQAKLLRVLEQKVVTRVGGTQSIPINVRVIAATNANLSEMVREKKFRQDLYFRLSVVTLDIPPLRERPEDIILLGKYFLSRFCRDANRKSLTFSPEAEKRLLMHPWPGNVRELRNLMERVAFLTQGNRVEVEDLAFILSPKRSEFDGVAEGIGLTEASERFQVEYIKLAVKRMQGNMSDTAEFLGLHRSNLYRKMRQLGMEVDDVKP